MIYDELNSDLNELFDKLEQFGELLDNINDLAIYLLSKRIANDYVIEIICGP